MGDLNELLNNESDMAAESTRLQTEAKCKKRWESLNSLDKWSCRESVHWLLQPI